MKKYLFLLFLISACVDPIVPEFDYENDIIFIDAYALTKKGLSSVSIKRSNFSNNSYSVQNIDNATVQFVNETTGAIINCPQSADGNYFPPDDFAVTAGESWKLKIELEDGRRYESKTELVGEATQIENIQANFGSELYFDDALNQYVPGHTVNIDWNDPADENNYYLWKFRSFEPQIVCQTCDTGRFRGGECTIESPWWGYVDYLCEVDCWHVRYSDKFQIADDRLFDGQAIRDRKIADIPFYRRQNVLVEIQQVSLTENAYDYFKIIDDISNESGGLNAPPPAALIGNMYNLDDSDELILGQFTAAGVSVKSIFIEREDLGATALTPDRVVRLENCGVPCPDSLVYKPCVEGDFRTSVRPEDWPQ